VNRLDLLLLSAPVLLFSMVAHEYAHGWAALRQGDRTAWALGRLTWNPLKHIDPFMTVLLPVMLGLAGAPILGGAKPVPVDPRNYHNLRRGDIIVSLAGVTANLLIALACVPAIVLAGVLGQALPVVARPLALLQLMAEIGIFLNLVLVAFNLLPIPPLDGSHVFKWVLPPRLARAYVRLAGAGVLVLVGLLYFVPQLQSLVVGPAQLARAVAQRVYLPFLLPNPLS
jgi:Zn-dependent protease